MNAPRGLFDEVAHDWQERLALIVETMREMSRQTDPAGNEPGLWQTHAHAAAEPIARCRSAAAICNAPWYRITRCSLWKDIINPWKEKDRLPLLRGGFFAELIYGDEPILFDDVQVADDDPAAEYVAGMRSLLAIPMYDRGVALNMVLLDARGSRTPSAATTSPKSSG